MKNQNPPQMKKQGLVINVCRLALVPLLLTALPAKARDTAPVFSCDLSIEAQLITGRQDEVNVDAFYGNRLWRGLMGGRPTRPGQGEWDRQQKIKVLRKCANEIRSEYRDTIISDINGALISRQFYCSEPEKIRTNGGRVRKWRTWLKRYTPVYATLSDEQVTRLRCDRVYACSLRASNEADLGLVSRLWTTQGCDLLPVQGPTQPEAAPSVQPGGISVRIN